MRFGKKTRLEAEVACRDLGLYETHGLDAFSTMAEIVRLAKRHHTIQEHHCNSEVSPRVLKLEENIEKRMKKMAEELGLKIRFDGDPWGFIVKLFAPNKASNTWGGRENGYGVGDK